MRSTFPSLSVGVNIVGVQFIDFCETPEICSYILINLYLTHMCYGNRLLAYYKRTLIDKKILLEHYCKINNYIQFGLFYDFKATTLRR